jgi:hypothetical protein
MTPTETLTPVLHRKVRAVMRAPGPECEALCHIASGSRRAWSLGDWCRLLDELDRCHDTVEEFLALHT